MTHIPGTAIVHTQCLKQKTRLPIIFVAPLVADFPACLRVFPAYRIVSYRIVLYGGGVVLWYRTEKNYDGEVPTVITGLEEM